MGKTVVPSYQEGLKELKGKLSSRIPGDAIEACNEDAEELQKKYTSVLKLQVGDKAPDFSLSNAINKRVTLSEVLKTNRVVLTFYRGTWCAYCNLVLNQYQAILPKIREAGGTLIAISPQTPDESFNMLEKNNLQFEVLSDNGNLIAKRFTTVHANPEKSLKKMTELGYDYNSFYADEESEIPIPAVFIIEQDGMVSFAKSEGGDYRNRVEPSEIINALNNNQS